LHSSVALTRVMKIIFSFLALSLAVTTASAQATAADCDGDTQLLITDALRELETTKIHVDDDPLTLCINSLVFFNVDDLGVLSLTSSGSYPFIIEVTDMVTDNVAVLSEGGDETTINKNQLYFFKLTPLAVGTGQVTLTPNERIVDVLEIPTEVIDVEILPAAALPVVWSNELIRTTVKSTHTFSWGVSLQENVASYYLESSSNGSFEVVGNVQPKPFYGEELFYELESPARTEDSYYRVRQVDFDGRSSISNLVFVPGQEPAEEVKVYPNPANDVVWAEGVIAGNQARLFSVTGEMVRNYGQLPEGGAIDVSGLGAGIYTLKFFGGSSKTQSARLVIR